MSKQIVFTVDVDTLYYEILQKLMSETGGDSEDVITSAITLYARMRIYPMELQELIDKYFPPER